MSDAFVWFHHNSDEAGESKRFYAGLLGWGSSDGPGGMTVLALEKGPFAGTGEKYGQAPGWIPFVQVPDVDASTRKAVELGASIIRDKARGPAGEFSVVRDPSGAAIALWTKA